MSNYICAREDTLHKRLQEERQRLGLTQDEFAEIGGVKRRAQINYESGDRCPDGHYFSAIAAAGADVQYILTGIRSINPPAKEYQPDPVSVLMAAEQNGEYTVKLRADQIALLDNVEHCAKEDQEAIKRMAFIAAKADKNEAQSGKKKKA